MILLFNHNIKYEITDISFRQKILIKIMTLSSELKTNRISRSVALVCQQKQYQSLIVSKLELFMDYFTFPNI